MANFDFELMGGCGWIRP